MKIKKGISVILNSKNEEKNIVACINSVKTIADELIVVDMNSSDNTIRLAKENGALVFKVKDYGYVEPARNYAISKATNTWVLLIDADERLTSFLEKTLKTIAKRDEYDVVQIPSKNILLKKWIKHSGWWPIHQVRFFKKTHVKWKNKIHSIPALKGKVLDLPMEEKYALIHHNISSIDEMLKKVDRYSSHEKNFKLQSLNSAKKLINYYENEFKWRYIDQKGYKDGIHGFILSKFMEFYRFLEIAKAWERNNYKEFLNNKELHEEIENKAFSRGTAWDIEYLKKENQELKRVLNEIQSSKYFKIWQNYLHIKSKFFKK